MSSSAQIVARALRRIRVIGSGEDPSAEDAADGLSALNAMIAGWQADGIEVSGDVPLDARFEEGVVALLAVRLADDFGATAPAGVVNDAAIGMRRLEAAFLNVPASQFDVGLTRSSTQNAPYACAPPALWKRKTEYAVGDQVQSNGRLYECITAGTSGILNPLATSSSIPDGSVTWKWVRDL